MYRQIVETIFNSIELSCLEHLLLDDLQDPGRTGDKYPYTRSETSVSNLNTTRDTEEIKLSGTTPGILHSLQDQCTSLRSFFYRKPGWWMDFEDQSASLDEQCYIELGSFLSSIGPTVENFTFEQGVSVSSRTICIARLGTCIHHKIPNL